MVYRLSVGSDQVDIRRLMLRPLNHAERGFGKEFAQVGVHVANVVHAPLEREFNNPLLE
jgi:hypothetical protein